MLDPRRLEQSLAHLGGSPPGSLGAELLAAYSEPTRFYHDSSHIAVCLQLLDRHRSSALRPDEVELALWFHDAIYDTQRSDNEEQSADWARRSLAAARLPLEVIERIAGMIRATKHHDANDSDTQLLLDIDLSILGEKPEVFARYDEAIRQEFSWVPDETYRAARLRILQSFLARREIFRTAAFQREFEGRARANLAARIDRLRERTAE